MSVKKDCVLQVYTVEDHHEVVPHIHRAIGCKLLPFEEVAFVHFDSHPDLLIPLDMPADTVYDKYTLYEKLSIENWIIPLVYAGHINEIFWIKPPWATQIQDKQIRFSVGKCAKTGTIRTTCKESYFVSEILYVPEEQLENVKIVTLTVLTLTPDKWPTIIVQSESRDAGLHAQIERDASIVGKSKNSPTLESEHLNELSNENKSKSLTLESDSKSLILESESRSSTLESESRSSTLEIETRDGTSNTNRNISSDSKHLFPTGNKIQDTNFSSSKEFEHLIQVLKNRPFILDIDLDFYSTKNPFKDVYTPRQYGVLKELYTCPPLQDTSDECVQRYIDNRKTQLEELKKMILNYDNTDEDLSINDSKRKMLVRELIEDIKKGQTEDKIDYNLIHEAGCTMDDSELPHHVSTTKQIVQLVQSTKDFLEMLPRPKIVTISRSSCDDYCPPDQVEYIQEAVYMILDECYVYIDINKDSQK